MGTPDFAVPSFLELTQNNYDVVAVYTRNPKPKGRGHKLQKTPIHILAEEKGIEVFTPINLKCEAENIKKLNPDLIIVVAYGCIVPKSILDIPKFGCINVHGSILPKYRGAAPIQHAILNGESESGTTIMQMDEGLDTGPIFSIKKIKLEKDETSISLYNKLKHIGAKHLIEVLKDNNRMPIKQPDEDVSYAPKVFKIDLDPNESVIVLDRKIRALSPSPGVWFNDIKIIKASPIVIKHYKVIGEVLEIDKNIMLSCMDGFLCLEVVQKQGGSAISARDWVNGLK